MSDVKAKFKPKDGRKLASVAANIERPMSKSNPIKKYQYKPFASPMDSLGYYGGYIG